MWRYRLGQNILSSSFIHTLLFSPYISTAFTVSRAKSTGLIRGKGSLPANGEDSKATTARR